MADSDETFERWVTENVDPDPVYPQVYSSHAGGTLEILFENANFYGEPNPGGIVIYRAQDDQRIVGCLIERLARFVEKQ